MASSIIPKPQVYHDIVFGGFKITNTTQYVREELVELLRKYRDDFYDVENVDIATKEKRHSLIDNCLKECVHYVEPVYVVDIFDIHSEESKLLEKYRANQNGPPLYCNYGNGVYYTPWGLVEEERQRRMGIAGLNVHNYNYDDSDLDDDGGNLSSTNDENIES